VEYVDWLRYAAGVVNAYEEVIEFIASGPSSSALAEFRASEEVSRRVEWLTEREKGGLLTQTEKAELDHFMELEHLMRLAKARARRRLADERNH
jgi:hypothetical protein